MRRIHFRLSNRSRIASHPRWAGVATPTRLGSDPDRIPWHKGLFLLFALLVSACGPANRVIPGGAVPGASLPAPGVRRITPTPDPVLSVQPSSTLPALPTLTSTPDLYAGLTIQDLLSRSYGGGELEIAETLDQNSRFTRYLIFFPSDGLRIFGFMNVPVGEGPFPIVIALHGYIDPDLYLTLDYTTRYADELARNGYLVLHPNLRGYAPSEDGPNLFRVGMAIDVLNLIALVQSQAGQPGPLAQADSSRIGLWGHSMGGGISTRVMTLNSDVDAVLLYAAMSGDEQKNFDRILNVFSNGERGLEELAAPPEVFQKISPIFFLDGVRAAVSIHHGSIDPEVPLEWSLDLCDDLQQLNKTVECFTYADQPHTFTGEGDLLFNYRMVDFFDRYLKAGD